MGRWVRLLAACLLGLPALVRGLLLEKPPPPITYWLKEHRPKVFFLAALEGSGTAVWQKLWKNSFLLEDDESQHVLKFPKAWVCGEGWIFTGGYDVMIEKLKTVKVKSVMALPFQATYPSCGINPRDHYGRMHTFHPDIEWLTHAAKDANTKLGIILMDRPIADSLRLTCIHRKYSATCAQQAEVLVQNAHFLIEQLHALEGSKLGIGCYNYSSDAAVQREVAEVFGSDLPIMKNEFDRRDITTTPHAAELPGVNMDDIRNVTAHLAEHCAKAQKLTMRDLRALIEYAHGDVKYLAQAAPPVLVVSGEGWYERDDAW